MHSFYYSAPPSRFLWKCRTKKQDKNLENTGQFTGHIKTYVATVTNEQSLRSEQLLSLSHNSTSIAIYLRNDQEKMHNSIFCLLFSCKFFHYRTIEAWYQFFHYRTMHYCTKRSLAIACHLSIWPSVCPSVCDISGSGPHRLKILETNCANN